MKKIILFLSIISFITVNSQTLKVDYKRISLTQYNSKEGSKEYIEKVRKKQMDGEDYVLFYKDGSSYFTQSKYNTIIHDNEPKMVKGKEVYLTEIYEEFPLQIYRNNNDEFFYIFSEEHGVKGYKKSKLKIVDVNYTDTTEKIENYTCRLVEFTLSGLNYKAWYTEDIPINAGPFAFGTFPGVVLKIESPQYVIYATKVSNEFSDNKLEKMDEDLPIFEE